VLGGQEIRDTRDWMAQHIEACRLWPDGQGAESVVPTEYRFDMKSSDAPPESIHRRYQVRLVRAGTRGGKAGTVAGGYQDLDVVYLVRVGYLVGGGDAIEGAVDQVETLAMQDAEAIRQRLEYPENRRTDSAGTVINPVLLSRLSDTTLSLEGEKLFAETQFVAWLRVTLERAA
jgi:hypothetical protein